jgi:type I R-M system specificity subunit
MITNIPKHWKIKKLGEIGKVKMCKRIFKDQTNKDSNGIPFYKIGTFGGIPDAFISKELYNEYKNKYPYPKKGDVLISAAGTIGRLVVFDGTPSYFQDSNIIWIENDENIALNKYLYHLYSNVKWKTTEGGIVSRLYNADVESLELPIPPLKEQEKIAEILLSCDKAIRLTTQIITQLKQRNQGLAQQLLTGEKRVKGFEKSVWKEVRLGEIGEISSAGVDKKVIEGEKPIRLLNYLDVYKRNFIHSDELTHWVTTTDEKIQKCNILQGDVFFTPSSEVRNDIAISAVAIEDVEEAVYSYHIVRLRFKKKIDLNFKAFMFKTDFFFKQAQFLSEGSGTRYVISQSNFKNIKIFLPTYEEQKTIGNILLKAEKELKLYEQKLQLLQAQKKTLMQKLLTGEILTIK